MLVYNTFMSYKSTSNTMYSCTYHLVWCPKYRRKVLVGDVAARLRELIKEIIATNFNGAEILEMEIMPDHVHLLVDLPPMYAPGQVIKRIKGRTSRTLRDEFPWLRTKLPTLWTNSYFVATVGGAPLSIVAEYIQNQKTSQRQKEGMG